MMSHVLVKSLTVKMLFTYITQSNRSISKRPTSAKLNGFLCTPYLPPPPPPQPLTAKLR